MRRCGTHSWDRAEKSQGAAASAKRTWFSGIGRRLATCLLLPIVFGCVTKGTYDEAADERDRLAAANRSLENRVEQLEVANKSLTAERVALIDKNEDLRISTDHNEREVAKLTRVKTQLSESLESSEALLAARSAEIEKMRSSYDGLIEDLEDEVSAGQIHIERLRSGLKLNLSDEILFPSGSASLSSGGQAVLRKVSRRLLELPHNIEVEGHTDDVPVARRYASNWELAAARASSVVRLMIEVGVEPERLKAVSRAEFAPVASNETDEGRAKNRRIEIQLDAPTNDSGGTSGAENPSADAGSETPEAGSSAPVPVDAEGPPAS
jgi:chemotaxis protein MotB